MRRYGQSFVGHELGLDATGWATMFVYQEMVKFVQQAIEWENVLYFIYPYFWDHPSNHPIKRSLHHPDSIHQTFLRGGASSYRAAHEIASDFFCRDDYFRSYLSPVGVEAK